MLNFTLKRGHSNQKCSELKQVKKYYKQKLQEILNSPISTRLKIDLVQMLKCDIKRLIAIRNDTQGMVETVYQLKKSIKKSYREFYDQIQPKCHSLVKIRHQFNKAQRQRQSKSKCRSKSMENSEELYRINKALKNQLQKISHSVKQIESKYEAWKLIMKDNILRSRPKIEKPRAKQEKQVKSKAKSKSAIQKEFASAFKRIRAL